MQDDIRLVFKFDMRVGDYRRMMVAKTFGNSRLGRILLLLVWLFFAALFMAHRVLKVIELSQVIYVCALLVFVAVPAAWLTMEINISKFSEAYAGGMKEKREIIVDSQGLLFQKPETKENEFFKWEDVTRLEELSDLYVIQLHRSRAVILPKRGMGDHKKIEKFIGLAEEKIPNRFYPLKKRKER